MYTCTFTFISMHIYKPRFQSKCTHMYTTVSGHFQRAVLFQPAQVTKWPCMVPKVACLPQKVSTFFTIWQSWRWWVGVPEMEGMGSSRKNTHRPSKSMIFVRKFGGGGSCDKPARLLPISSCARNLPGSSTQLVKERPVLDSFRLQLGYRIQGRSPNH